MREKILAEADLASWESPAKAAACPAPAAQNPSAQSAFMKSWKFSSPRVRARQIYCSSSHDEEEMKDEEAEKVEEGEEEEEEEEKEEAEEEGIVNLRFSS